MKLSIAEKFLLAIPPEGVTHREARALYFQMGGTDGMDGHSRSLNMAPGLGDTMTVGKLLNEWCAPPTVRGGRWVVRFKIAAPVSGFLRKWGCWGQLMGKMKKVYDRKVEELAVLDPSTSMHPDEIAECRDEIRRLEEALVELDSLIVRDGDGPVHKSQRAKRSYIPKCKLCKRHHRGSCASP